MSAKVNLDALIPREDFEVADEAIQHQPVQTLQIRNLESEAFFYSVLRKPDFQRETTDWTPEKICELIQSFLDGDLIPAVILWQHSGSYIFVIDGAHRLSALIAWVHDDYGDGLLSKSFFDQRIPEEQLEVAERTRRLIQRNIGSYGDHKFAIRYPEKSKLERVEVAKRLASLSLQLQWVRGNASQAQASFFKINQQAAPIDQTELKLLKSRKKPNAMSARAIIRSGTGHKYWSKFQEDKQQIIEQMAKEINAILFTPALHTPIKTLDLPVAGRGYSAQTLPLVFELVNLTNNVRSEKQEKLSPDNDGSETIQFLKETRKIVYRISGTHPSSLGLHPAVYFYSATGRYQPTAFLAIVGLIMGFEKRSYFDIFTMYRNKFEDFLLEHKSFAKSSNLEVGEWCQRFWVTAKSLSSHFRLPYSR